jgi:hypothetical protein
LPDGWEVENPNIVHNQPAVLRFSDSNKVSFYGQPQDWGKFRIRIHEILEGHFLLQYALSSLEPFSESRGELIIRLVYV